MSQFVTPNISHDLSNQVAMITGATSGLGEHFARVLAACGAAVVVCGRRVDRLESLTADITAAGGQCLALPLDMTGADGMAAAVATAEKHFGTVTILVNNAGVPDAQHATKMPLDLIDRVIDTNLKGPFVLAREVAARLIATEKAGRIINIASIAAFVYRGNGAALYSTTKSAIARMTEALAVEWARYPINVNAIAPGFFESEMTDAMVQRMGDITRHFPRKRGCVPAQLDSTLLFLCSPASECVTGTIIKVDDGQEVR